MISWAHGFACCKLVPTLARLMWRHNYVIGRNECLISTLSESAFPWVYSLQFLFKSTNNSWRYEIKREWVFFFLNTVYILALLYRVLCWCAVYNTLSYSVCIVCCMAHVTSHWSDGGYYQIFWKSIPTCESFVVSPKIGIVLGIMAAVTVVWQTLNVVYSVCECWWYVCYCVVLTISGVVGVHSVAYAFPKVHLVTTAVDPAINDQFYILPGIGKEYCRSYSLFTVYCAVFSTKLLLVIFRSTPLTRPSKTSNVRPSIHKTSFHFQRNLIRKQRLMTNIWWHAVWPDPWSRSRMSESCENDQFQSQYACNQLTNSELRYFKTVFT